MQAVVIATLKLPKESLQREEFRLIEAIPACSTSQTEVSAASLSASAHKIKNNLVQNNTEMVRECYLLLTDMLSVIGKCPPQCLAS